MRPDVNIERSEVKNIKKERKTRAGRQVEKFWE